MVKNVVEKYLCIKCNKKISLIARTRHDRACDGVYKIYKTSVTTSKECIFCKKVFTSIVGCGVHLIQCKLNPEHIVKKTDASWNRGLTAETDARIAKGVETLKHNMTVFHGMYSDPNLEVARRRKISQTLKASKTAGGYRKNAGRSKKFKVLDSFGKETVLQSTYELDVFEILCELGINWVRPKALKYDDRNYFADFYLPDYDIWLDPKNAYKAKCDATKIQKVKEQNNVKLFILTKEQITKEYIGRLAEMD